LKKIPAETPGDQKVIDDLSEIIEDLRKENSDLRRNYEELHRNYEKQKKEFDDYKVRHPDNVGVKNGKPYFFKPGSSTADPVEPPRTEKKKPGARIGHRGYHRTMPDHVDEERRVPPSHSVLTAGQTSADLSPRGQGS
jgi:hypothetical protein